MNAKTLMTTALAGLLATAAHAITSEEIAAALDVDPSVGTFSCEGSSPWTIDLGVSHCGGSSLKSGVISHNQTCTPVSISVNCAGATKISFWYKTSTESGCDLLNFYVDGSRIIAKGGENGWQQIVYPLTEGHHDVSWTYSKDGSANHGSDCVWIDDLKMSLIFPKTTRVAVSDIRCTQRVPWNGKVDIDYTVTCDDVEANVWVYPIGYDKDSDKTMAPRALEGDGVNAPVKAGTHRMTWTVTDDYPDFNSTAFTIKMTALVGAAPYMVVDLSGGVDALSYPISYLSSVPEGGWSDEYKTTKLVLRLIPPGRFMMGSPSDELGHNTDLAETLHEVFLTRPFYIGVFECTQRQYELVMGSNPSSYKGAARPVECVSYSNIRGSVNGVGWPQHNQVDANSFMGRLRSKVNMLFDLPTESQWEYACRAGTSTALNSGKNISNVNTCAEANEVGRYSGNTNDKKGGYSQHTTVGLYLENAWGLYDMHGNTLEWCRDCAMGDWGAMGVIDPVGAASGSDKAIRGGTFQGGWHTAQRIRSAMRHCAGYTGTWADTGFRVYCSPVAQ